MSKISKNILLIGQTFLTVILAILLGYLLSVRYTGQTAVINSEILDIFLENMIFSLVLLWGGAFLFDYIEKTEK